MSGKQDIFIILFLLFFFCIGVWEADIASKNDSDYVYYSNLEELGYIFTTIKAIINILFGIFGTFLFLIRRNVDDLISSDLGRFYCINFGTTIWCIIMFFEIINNNSDFGPFQQVIIVEFFIFITCIGMIVFSNWYVVVFACIINGLVKNQINNQDSNQEINKYSNQETDQKPDDLKVKINDDNTQP
jgi:hypothetical protein